MRNIPLQVKSGTAAEWAAENPVLLAGEPGWSSDDEVLKIGDGSTAWASLPQANAGGPGGAVDWGDIGGVLSAQTDLQSALDGKQAAGSYAAASHTHAQADITNLTTDLAAKGNATFLSGVITTTANATTTYAALTGSDITVEAGKTYEIRWRLRTYSAANTTGLRLRRVLGGGAAGTVHGMHYLMMSNATAMIGQSSREGTNDPGLGLGNATNTTTASGTYWVDALFVCTTGGTFGLEMAAEVAASTTVDGDGSYWTAVVRTT